MNYLDLLKEQPVSLDDFKANAEQVLEREAA